MTHNLLDMHAPRDTRDNSLTSEHRNRKQSPGGDNLVLPGSRISHLTVKTFKKINESE